MQKITKIMIFNENLQNITSKKKVHSYRTSIFGSEALIASVHKSDEILIVMSFPLPEAFKRSTVVMKCTLCEA